MPIYGQHEATEAISNSPFGGLFAARITGTDELDRVVKLHCPPPYVLTPEQERARLEAFLESVRLQMSLKKHWAEIYEAEPILGGAFYAGRRYPLTARKLVASQTHVSDADLAAIVHGIVDGLVELDAAAHRPHANLKPENVLLCRESDDGRSGALKVCLTDPAGGAAASGQTSTADTYALGTIIYELVTLQKFPGPRAWPLIASDAWSRLGPGAGDAWCTLCNRLLHPNPEQGVIDLTDLSTVLRRTRSLRPGGRSRRWRIAAVVALILAVAGGTGYLLRHRFEPGLIGDHGHVDQLLAQARAAVTGHDDATAKVAAQSVLSEEPGNSEAISIMQGIEARRTQAEGRQLHSDRESQINHLLLQAEISDQNHDFQTALVQVDQALQLEPGQAAAVNLKRQILIAQQRRQDDDAAIHRDLNVRSLLNRAQSDCDAGRTDDARDEIDLAMALEPDRREVVAGLQAAVVRRQWDDFQTAAVARRQARAAGDAAGKQRDLDLQIAGGLDLARTKDTAGDEQGSLDAIDGVLALDPNQPDALNLRPDVVKRLKAGNELAAALKLVMACDTPNRALEGIDKIRGLAVTLPGNADVLKVQTHFQSTYRQAWAASWLRDISSKGLEKTPHSDDSDRLVVSLFQAQRRAGDDAGVTATLVRARKIAETDQKPAAAVDATIKVATLQLIAADNGGARNSIAQAVRIRAGVSSNAAGEAADRLIILALARAGERRMATDALASLIARLKDELTPAEEVDAEMELNRELAGGLAWGGDFGPGLNPAAETGLETNVEINLARLRSGDPLRADTARRSAAALQEGGFNACLEAEIRSGDLAGAKKLAAVANIPSWPAANLFDLVAIDQARGGDFSAAKTTLAQRPPGGSPLMDTQERAWAAIITAEAMKDPDAAQTDLTAHLAGPTPERKSAVAGIGSGLIANGRIDEAKPLLLQFSNSDDDWKLKIDPLSRLIENLTAAGDLTGAREAVATAPPAYRLVALRGLVRGAAHGGNYDAAEKAAADEAHQSGLDGSKNELLKTIARYAGETGDRDGAMRWLDGKPRDPILRIELLTAFCDGLSTGLPPRFDYRMDIDGREKYWRAWS